MHDRDARAQVIALRADTASKLTDRDPVCDGDPYLCLCSRHQAERAAAVVRGVRPRRRHGLPVKVRRAA